MPWQGKKDVLRHNKKCAKYAPCRRIWLNTANKYFNKTGNDGQAVIRANVNAKKWLQKHGKYNRNPDSSELFEVLKSLKEDNILITYHGTTREQANSIIENGFSQPNLFGILLNAYKITGLTRDVRRNYPIWLLDYITNDMRMRLYGRYRAISFAPHGVASRWAGTGGEVLHETVNLINWAKAFMKSPFPKTEDGFDAWSDTDEGSKRYYQEIGEPVVLKAWIKVSPKMSNKIISSIEYYLDDFGQEEAWRMWNFGYRDDRVTDPSQILHIEFGDPPFTGRP